jgi:hypothetical protein
MQPAGAYYGKVKFGWAALCKEQDELDDLLVELAGYLY